MKFLLDQNLSPSLAVLLEASGHDAVHVRQFEMSEAKDPEILTLAVEQSRIIISSDTDFGELLAIANASAPSFILFRRQDHRRASELGALLLLNLAAIEEDLDTGAVVVFDHDRIRVRRLPFRPVR